MDLTGLTSAPDSKPKTKEREKASFLERDIQVFPHAISDKEKIRIYQQLSTLLTAGVDIKTAFDILFKQIKNKKSRAKLEQVLETLIKGKTLSESFAAFSDFTPYEIYSIKIGEETGRLTTVLNKLTLYFEGKISQRRQIVSALSYPAIITLTSIGAVSFMILFIIPMFEEVFARFQGELPGLTKTVIALANGLKGKAPFYAIVLIGLVSIGYYYRKTTRVQYWKEVVILKIPIINEIYKGIYLARFCDSMSLLIHASVPLLTCLEMVEKMIGFQHIQNTLGSIRKDLMQGKTFSSALDIHPIYDDQMKAFVKVGEEVNQLAHFFDKLGTEYTDSVKYKTGLLSTFLEPVMIVFLGLMVGLILVAMYLPMFELSSSMDFGN